MKKAKKIIVVLGFHVNYNHSYRGDRNDDSGFGYDSKVIRSIIGTLDRANDRGLDARGTWDFDHFWSVQNCMKRYAPDILSDLERRISSGPDEAILDNWNNGIMSCMTRGELRASLSRAITNEGGSGLDDLFGSYSPVVRSQETMFTHGCIETFAELGIKALALYYSAIPFDSIRNFVPRLSPNERYNPLRLKSPVSEAETLVIPMYNQGDIQDNLSLEVWLNKIHLRQEHGDIPGNALLYINMDADAKLWTGMGLPKFLDWVPNTRGLDEYIETVNKLDYAEFGSLGDYIANNPPAGEIRVDVDTADGSHTGYSSWSEKWINYPLWTLHQQTRRWERLAASLIREKAAPANVAAEAEALLYGPGLSAFECRVLTASTTHFGLASPMINPERLRVAFHFAAEANRKARRAFDLLTAAPASAAVDDNSLEFTLISPNKYENVAPHAARALAAVRVALPAPLAADPLKLRISDSAGRGVPFDMRDSEETNETTLYFIPPAPVAANKLKLTAGTSPAAKGNVRADDKMLSNGLVTVRFDEAFRVVSLQHDGKEFSSPPLFAPGVTYRVNGKDVWFGPDNFEIDPEYGVFTGPRGRYGSIALKYAFTIRTGRARGDEYSARGFLRMSVFEGLPHLYIIGGMSLPQTPCTRDDIGIATRISTRFDPDWREVMPLQMRPGFANLHGSFLKVWKHNYLDVTHAYDLDWGSIDPRNRDVDSFNNHVTDGWVAVSNGEMGLLLAHDQSINSSMAMCPMRLRERNGVQSVLLNPFGEYMGRQLSQLPDGSGTARELMIAAVPSIETTAPSYNGKSVAFKVMLAPYEGGEPPRKLQQDAEAFSMPPAAMAEQGGKQKMLRVPGDKLASTRFPYEKEFGLAECAGWTYDDFLTDANSRPPAPGNKAAHDALPKLPLDLIMKLGADMLAAKFGKIR